ncbi:SCO family protein [Ralstonia pseudosolanacearum]|uniref:SCO family protein n=2 Tax=Ralstonia pseudosolanacearum TaxID=1310165 RepID=UPI002003FF1B|nr:SCO family protein [Ralstonia pseudosolanacearum]MCK4154182.1 SCO family protein [Ralstonia pseudosolanacearum]
MASGLLPWTQERFKAAVAEAAAQPDCSARTQALLVLMREEHPAYVQCSAAEVVRRRGWVLVELGNAGLEPAAMPVVLEELETGHQPYLLAAAARALRQAEAPSPALAPILLRALEALVRRDDLVDLTVWGGTAASDAAGSALGEALATLRWLAPQAHGIRQGLRDLADGAAGPLAEDHRLAVQAVLDDIAARDLPDSSDCCALPLSWRRFASGGDAAAPISTVCFEDQDGVSVSWDHLFLGQPSVVAFFYTRCDNEQKCSLTVSQLAQVQRLLVSAGAQTSVRLAAITYDPDFDLPHRLRGYAESRSLVPGAHCRMLRTTQGRDALQDYFTLGVNFAGSVVNRHRIEVFVLDASGRIRATYQRLGWDPVELVNEVQRITNAPERIDEGQGKGAAITGTAPGLWALLLALLPKCPICGATYLSSSGLLALPYLSGWQQSWPAILLLLIINLAAMAWFARSRKRWWALAWSVAGAVTLIGPGLALGHAMAMVLGAAFTAVGSLLAAAAVVPDIRGGGRGPGIGSVRRPRRPAGRTVPLVRQAATGESPPPS